MRFPGNGFSISCRIIPVNVIILYRKANDLDYQRPAFWLGYGIMFLEYN